MRDSRSSDRQLSHRQNRDPPAQPGVGPAISPRQAKTVTPRHPPLHFHAHSVGPKHFFSQRPTARVSTRPTQHKAALLALA